LPAEPGSLAPSAPAATARSQQAGPVETAGGAAGPAASEPAQQQAADQRAAGEGRALGFESARNVPRELVPIDIRVGGDFDLLVITGPNTGGKTVALKTTGLLVAMAQAGLHVPAEEGCRIPVFDQILADIGDEQSIEQSLSTFSAHVRRIGWILRRATDRSLVLLDELGAGTDPAEGAALGRAIMDELLRRGAATLVTTHLSDLKLYALTQPRAENAAVQFDANTLAPKYKVLIGDTGRSCALIVARRLELGDELVDRAERYHAESQAGRPVALEVLERARAETEAARAAAWRAQQEARQAKEAYEQKRRELEETAAAAVRLEQFRRELTPGQKVFVPRFKRPATVLRVDQRRKRATVKHGAMQWELDFEELMPADD
jgi:DNA mismatch repair protein MutS2